MAGKKKKESKGKGKGKVNKPTSSMLGTGAAAMAGSWSRRSGCRSALA